ncbi:hypothetical protein KTS45_17530 [Halomicroarcula limicola]|uniref:YapH protein n=1 Tax=Haloarcula limicola TaxID=1429915 RepID=A0A8J8C8E8_9EURY|nr:hypothetical protein [Halomicroarcula limicola]MBV0926008.1 hypothetical protein [Halomicroarcula limicola]
MTWVDTAIIAVKTVILLLGGGITVIAYKAYRRTEAPSLRVLGVGFGIITLGALLAGIANQALSVSLETGVLINSLLVAVGLAIIMYSLYMEQGD